MLAGNSKGRPDAEWESPGLWYSLEHLENG
jgi:hypothetical protein